MDNELEKEKRLATSLLRGDVTSESVLDDEFQIENALVLIKNIQDKTDWLKTLKKKRLEEIDKEIKATENYETTIRQVIMNTVKKCAPNKKTLEFPAVGKVSRKMTKPNWEVSDEDAVIQFLRKEGKKEALKVSVKIVKKELNSLCDEYSKSGTKVPGVSRTESSETLAITLAKDSSMDRKAASIDMGNLDELDEV